MTTSRGNCATSGGAIALLILLLLPALAAAGESGYPDISGRGPNYLFPKNQEFRFVSLHAGMRSMSGEDFEGTTFYSSESEMFMIPELDDAPSAGLYLEFRQGWYGGGIGYSYASHDWSFLELEAEGVKASSHFMDFNFQGYLLADRPVQPFGLIGCSFNGIRVEDGKYNVNTDSFSNLSMWGFGMNWGGGVDFYPTTKFKLTAGAKWHWAGYNKISGNDLDEGLSSWGVNYYVSAGFFVG